MQEHLVEVCRTVDRTTVDRGHMVADVDLARHRGRTERNDLADLESAGRFIRLAIESETEPA
jgi:hypothetical protein